MKKLSILTILLITQLFNVESALANCPADPDEFWTNCAGVYNYPNGQYNGEFKNDKRHGQGTFNYSDGNQYIGEYKDNKQHGQGTYTWANGDRYIGEFKDGKFHGQGTYTYSDGSTRHGWYEDDVCKYSCTVTSPIETSSDSLSQPDNNQSSAWDNVAQLVEGEKGLKCTGENYASHKQTYYLINIDAGYIRDVLTLSLSDDSIDPNMGRKSIGGEVGAFYLDEIPIRSDAYEIKWAWINPLFALMTNKKSYYTLNRETLKLDILDWSTSRSNYSCNLVDAVIVQDLLKDGLKSMIEEIEKADKDSEEQLKKNQL